METLRDIFATEPDDQPPTQATPVASHSAPADPAQVDRDYQAMLGRVAQAARAEVARQNAATARAAIQCFDNYARAFRKVAQTKGSPVDHFVDIDLAEYCDRRIAALQVML